MKVKKAKSSFPKMDDTVSDTVHCTDYEYVKFTVHLYREFLSMHLGGRIIQYVYENKFILTNRVLAQLVHLYFFTTSTPQIRWRFSPRFRYRGLPCGHRVGEILPDFRLPQK
jgi:hypothetical protein